MSDADDRPAAQDEDQTRISDMTQEQARSALLAVRARLDELDKEVRRRALSIEVDVRQRRRIAT